MDINKIIKLLKEDLKQPSRFPVRVVLIDSLTQYLQFIEEIKSFCDKEIKLSDYCDGKDIFPRIDRLKNDLSDSNCNCIQVLSMGEYLRVAYKRELPGQSPQFANLFNMQQDSSLTKKIIIPLYACEQHFEKIIGKIDERHKEHVFRFNFENVCEESFTLKIYPKEFENVLKHGEAINGFKEWLQLFDEGVKSKKYSLVTKLHSYVEEFKGTYSTKKIYSLFDYIVNNLEDGYRLKKDWGGDFEWEYFAKLLDRLKNGDTISSLIKKGLNLIDFDAMTVLAKWKHMDGCERWLFWLWYKINNSNDYISYAVLQSSHYNNVPQSIRNAVFEMPLHKETEWLEERKKAIDLLNITPVDNVFFNNIVKVSDKKRRLRLLTYDTHDECVFAIKTIAQLLDEGMDINDIIKIIQDKYPMLANYLQSDWNYGSSELEDYFGSYKKNKIRNLYNEEIDIVLEKTYGVIENIDTRFSALKKLAIESNKTFVLWIDGLGAEWCGLFLYELLKLNPEIKYRLITAKAIAPTETNINNQWEELGYPYKKIERFDKLAHKGQPDMENYYSCVVKQLEFIGEFAKEALNILNEYESVIITSDHGTSRLAALAFHKLVGVNPPENGTPKSLGRYCEMHGEIKQEDIHPSTKKVNNYIVFRTHEHYKTSGNAGGINEEGVVTPGEIHGGMTPEELLVPVIALYKKENELLKKIDYKVDCKNIQPNENNEIELTLQFNNKVQDIKVFSENNKGLCNSSDGLKWQVIFKNLSFGEHTIEVVADNKLLDKSETIIVKTRGLEINDDFLI